LLAVLCDRDILLGLDQKAAIELVTAIRSKMPATTVNILHLIQKAKIRAFREKSFFYYKKRYNLYKILFPVVEPDPEVVLKNDLYTLNIAFAEEGVESKVNDLNSKNK
jgi:hypothetical protein